MDKVAVWKPVEYEGMEHLALLQAESEIVAYSVVIGIENLTAFRLDYTVRFSRNYIVREVSMAGFPSQSLYLRSDGYGKWSDAQGGPLAELDGCIDVDISATPFTNTLPIRRIQWQVGQVETFKMVYILIPDLKVSVMRQRYTCLEKSDQGATFRYENMDDDFKADITVDSDGLVLNYPGLFERVF